jgi:serine/threonine protein kinase
MSPDADELTLKHEPPADAQSTDADAGDPHATRLPDTDPYATRVPTPEEDAAQRAAARELPTIPGLEHLEEVGRGGMGIVYRATQTALNRRVAVKMILAGQHASREVLDRFRTEAEAVARLQHPNIIQIHQIDYYQTAAGTLCPYLIFEYAECGSLERRLNNKPMDPRQAAELVEILARAMAVAHDEGIVHRDLKPANILLQAAGRSGTYAAPTSSMLKKAIAKVEEDSAKSRPAGSSERSFRFAGVIPKITDFGLAKQAGSDLTATGAIMGTPAYMSPEQASGNRTIDASADRYALGAILYECLTGRPPFLGATPLATLDLVRHQDPVSPRRLQPGVPLDLDTICLKCLQKKSKDRYASALDLADDLKRFLEGEPISIRPPSRLELALRWSKKHPLRLTLTAAMILLTVAIGAVILQQQRLSQVRLQNERDRLVEQDRVNRELEAKTQLTLKDSMKGLSRNIELLGSADLRSPAARAKVMNGFIDVYEELLNNKHLEADKLYRADGLLKLGLICKKAAEYRKATKALEESRRLLLTAQTEKPLPVKARLVLARTLRELAILERDAGDFDSARKDLRDSEQTLTALSTEVSVDRETRNELAEARHQLAELSNTTGDYDRALRLFQDAIRLRTDVVQAAAADAKARDYRKDLARSHGYVGDVQRQLGMRPAAEASYAKSLELRDALVDQDPLDQDAQFQLARGHENMGNLYALLDRPADSVAHFKRARTLLQTLVQANPGVAEYQLDLVRIDNAFALILAAQKEHEEAGLVLHEGRELLRAMEGNEEASRLTMQAALAWTLAQQARYRPTPDSREAFLRNAENALKAVEGSRRKQPIDPYVAALILLQKAELPGADRQALRQQAQERLDEAVKRGLSYVPQVKVDPLFGGLRVGEDAEKNRRGDSSPREP